MLVKQTLTSVPRAFHLGPSSLAGAGCCEMRAEPVVFDAAVFWSNSQPGAVDQEDLVVMRNAAKSQRTVMSRPQKCCCKQLRQRRATTNAVFVSQLRNVLPFQLQ